MEDNEEIVVLPLHGVNAEAGIKPCPECGKNDIYPIYGEEICVKCALKGD